MTRLVPTRFAILVLSLSAISAGCGYHISGRGDLLPKTVKTIAVMPFNKFGAPVFLDSVGGRTNSQTGR